MQTDQTTNNEQNFLFTNQKYTEQFFNELRKFFIENKFTDVIICCDSKEIACHKVVLSSFSKYFCAMFSSDLLETQTNKVYMNNFDYKTLIDIINYAYCGSIEINVNNVQNILSISSLLQVNEIFDACCDYMETQLDINNCIDVYYYAQMHNSVKLKQKSKEFLDKNFILITNTDEFINLSGQKLIDLLLSDDLNIDNENLLIDVVIKWINYDFNKRICDIEALFNCIRFNLCDLNDIDNQIIKELTKVNTKFNDYADVIKRIIKYKSDIDEKKRAGMNIDEDCFLIIGGNYDLDADCSYINCLSLYDYDKYQMSTNLSDKSKNCKGYYHIENPGVCVTDKNRIFVAGGFYVYHDYKLFNNLAKTTNDTDRTEYFHEGENYLSKEMYEYDSIHDSWIRRCNMLFAKSNFTLCSINNLIYSFGGITLDEDRIDIVECYDIDKNVWTYVGTMPTPFISGAVVAYGNLFYIMGGRVGANRINSCFLFKPDDREWIQVSSMRVGRFNFGACVINDKIYVIGGQRYLESTQSFYTREALDSVEIYDITCDQWSIGPSTPNSIYNTGVCLLNDHLYVCGTTEYRQDTNSMFGYMFTSVFKLNVANGDWTTIEHDFTDITSNYRCLAAKINTRKLRKHVKSNQNKKTNLK